MSPWTPSPAPAVAAAILPWLTWLAAGVVPFVIGLALAYGLALTGPPDPPAAPVDPDRFPLDVAAAAVLVTVLGTIALTWAALRFLLARAHPEVADPSTPGAAVVVGLVLSVATLCLWVVDPFAALLLAPTLHLWILAALVDPPPPQRARIALVAGGLLLPALLALYVLVTLALDPIGAAW